MNCSTATEESKNELLDVVLDPQLPILTSHRSQPQRKTSNLLKKTLRADSSSSIKNLVPSFPLFERRGLIAEFTDSSERVSFGENYTPFKYPGSIEEALLHEEANILGVNEKQKAQDSMGSNTNPSLQYQNSIKDKSKCCPCCGKTIKDKKLSFFQFNYQSINEKYGGSVSYLFQVNKLFIVTTLVLILIYYIYFQIQAEKVCSQVNQRNHYMIDGHEGDKSKDNPKNFNSQCTTLFRLSIISEVQLRRQSDKGTQIVLADLKFIILLLLQVSNIFFFQSANLLKTMKKIKQETKLTKLRKKSILIKQLPQFYTEEEIVKNIQLIVKNTYNLNVKIACITHIYDIYERNKLINERMSLLQKIYRATDQVKKNKLIDKLVFNYTELRYLSNQSATFSGSIIITFLSEKDKVIVYNLLKKSYFLQLAHKIKTIFNIASEPTTRRAICEKAPELSEIIWSNIGHLGKKKGQLSFLLIIMTLIIFIGLPKLTEFLYQWQFQSKQSNESLKEKAIDYFISLLLFIISNLVWIGMKYLLTKSKQSTTLIESIYMVVCNFTFHLQFYIIVPIFLTYFSQNFSEDVVNYSNVNIKAYGIVTLISGFSGLSLLEVFLGPSFLLHRFRKWQTQKKKKQYFQAKLNQIFERPSFPLEKRVLILYKQYTFGIVVSFICPIAWLYVLVGLIFHFIGNRMAIVYQYSIYNFCNYKIVTVATRIASITMMYVVTISYLLTEQLEGFYIRENYIQFAKYMLVFNVFINTICERVYKAIVKRRKSLLIIQKKMMKREESFEVTEDGNENLYAYYNKQQEVLGRIHPSWSDEKVEEIIQN